MFAAALLGFYWQLSTLDGEIDHQRTALKNTTDEAKKLDKIKKQYDALAAWQQSDIVWLDELAGLSQAVSPPQAAMLTNLNLDTGGLKGAPQIKIEGVAASLSDVGNISDRLRKHVELASGKLGKDTKLASYPEKFDATLTIKPADTKAQLARLSAPPPPADEGKKAADAAPPSDKALALDAPPKTEPQPTPPAAAPQPADKVEPASAEPVATPPSAAPPSATPAASAPAQAVPAPSVTPSAPATPAPTAAVEAQAPVISVSPATAPVAQPSPSAAAAPDKGN